MCSQKFPQTKKAIPWSHNSNYVKKRNRADWAAVWERTLCLRWRLPAHNTRTSDRAQARWQVSRLQTQWLTGKSSSGNPLCSCKGKPWAADSLQSTRNSPVLERSRSLLLKRGKAAAGRRVDWLVVACLSEGSSAELLLTSQVRESCDPLLCTEARCCSPSLLAGYGQKGERAEQLTANRQWLLAPTMSYRLCASCRFALPLLYRPSQLPLWQQDLSSVCGSSLHRAPAGPQKRVFTLKKVSLLNHYLPSSLSTA